MLWKSGRVLVFPFSSQLIEQPRMHQTLTFGLVGTFTCSLEMTQGLGLCFCCEDARVIASVGVLRGLLAFALLSSAMGMNKKKTNGNPWETSSSRKSRWVRKILPPTYPKLLYTSVLQESFLSPLLGKNWLYQKCSQAPPK